MPRHVFPWAALRGDNISKVIMRAPRVRCTHVFFQWAHYVIFVQLSGTTRTKKTKLKDDPLSFSSESPLPLTLQRACPSVVFSLCFNSVFRFGRPAASPCWHCTEHTVVLCFWSFELIHGMAHAPTSCAPGLVVATYCRAGRVALGTQSFPHEKWAW